MGGLDGMVVLLLMALGAFAAFLCGGVLYDCFCAREREQRVRVRLRRLRQEVTTASPAGGAGAADTGNTEDARGTVDAGDVSAALGTSVRRRGSGRAGTQVGAGSTARKRLVSDFALAAFLRGVVEDLRQRREEKRCHSKCERDFPALLDIVALGLRSGMSFDSAFEMYAVRFDTELARICREELPSWRDGLVSREQGMKHLASRVGTPSFARFVALVLRSIRFGMPMTKTLSELADEARREYRALREKRVAKAPVRMLIPTALFVLPAMLLLVLGPVLLDLMNELA